MAFEDYNDRIIAEFRANDGEVAHFGRDLVLVHHVGAKSGIERVSPLMGIRVDDDTWLIAASKAGAPSHPAWYHNLLAHPEVLIETADAGTVAVRARELIGAERDEAWTRFTTRSRLRRLRGAHDARDSGDRTGAPLTGPFAP